MKKIYADTQIELSAFKGHKKINSAIRNYKDNGWTFLYSPAHTEEIAKSAYVHGHKDYIARTQHLNELSERWIVRPSKDGDAIICQEDAFERLSITVRDDGREKTEFARDYDKDVIGKIRKNHCNNKEYWKKTIERVGGLGYREVFLDQDVLSCLEGLARAGGFRRRAFPYFARVAAIDILYRVLDLFGFAQDLNELTIENRMHDVSHSIYASYADLFVTDDVRLQSKSRAIYFFLNIDVPVLCKSEFLELKHL